jgi:hypothetical protein
MHTDKKIRCSCRLSTQEHRELKATAALHGMTVEALLIDAIKDWLKRFRGADGAKETDEVG